MDTLRSLDSEIVIKVLLMSGGIVGLAILLTMGAMLCLAIYKGYKRFKN